MSASRESPLTAPPSTAYRIVDVPEVHRELIQRRGIPGTFVGMAEEESPWVPFGENAAIRHLAFDVRHNIFSNVSKPGTYDLYCHHRLVQRHRSR
jgi:2,4'-dihydroxyacetophenone dioxygenase